MKRLIVLAAILAVFSFSNAAVANSPDPSSSPQSMMQWSSYSVLDDIKIPDEILLGIQMEYQGFAVTKAAKVTHNGQEMYQLRVDRSDIPVDYDGFYLYFDMKWRMVEKEDIEAPAPMFRPAAQKPAVEEVREENSGPPEDREEETSQEPIEDDSGNDDSEDDSQAEPAPQPEPEPEPADPIEPPQEN